MKFSFGKINLKITCLCVLIAIISSTTVESKTKTQITSKMGLKSQLKTENSLQMKNKGKRSATEFFNELFTQKSSSEMENPLLGYSDVSPEPKKQIDNLIKKHTNNNNIPAPTGEKIKNSTASLGEVESPDLYQDWLMISSPDFKNKNIFPKIKLNDDSTAEIKTDSNFFRINDGFRQDQISDKSMPPTNQSFWFRLSQSNLSYSSTTTDINILGALAMKTIKKISLTEISKFACFRIDYIENQEKPDNKKNQVNQKKQATQFWTICAKNEEIRKKWVCRIEKIVGLKDQLCGFGSKSNAPKKIIQPIIIIPLPSPVCNEDWNYQQNGRDWQCDCKGPAQSPIDIPKSDVAIDSPVKPIFQYEEVKPKSTITTLEGILTENQYIKIQYIDNSVKIFHNYFGKVITLDGGIYHAQEIVIHTPAEHQIGGKKYDMEIQIIHYGQTQGDIAKQVILSFLFEKKPGVYNKFIDDLDIFNLPNPSNKEVELTHNLHVNKILYSSEDDEEEPVMKPFSFYTYQGSLTSPPCTENTIVYVASKPLKIGTTALQLFQEAIRQPDIVNQKGDVIPSDWLPMSNREVQPLNGRPVFYYDHQKYCGPDPVKPKAKPVGHFERIQKTETKYFYVNGLEPSGLPGAFYISKDEASGPSDKLLK